MGSGRPARASLIRAFFDTNILVYLFDSDAAEKQERARELVPQQAESAQVLLSTQVLQDFFVAVTRKLSRPLPVDGAMRAIRRLAAFQVVQVDTATILDAVAVAKRFGFSFRDALIVQAARQGGAEILYSEDLQRDQDVEGVRIFNPFLPHAQ